MTLASWKTWAGRVWLGLLVLFGAVAIYYQPFSWREFYDQLNPTRLIASLLLIVLGKLLTVLLVQQSLAAFHQKRDFLFAWYAYSLGDIAKYLPGGVWGFVGSLTVFKSSGIALTTGSWIIVFETGVRLAASLLTGLGLVIATRQPALLPILPLALAVLAMLLVKLKVPTRLLIEIVLGQIAASLFFGASFAIISDGVIQSDTYAAGVFNISFVTGSLAIFAPSGLGVREIVINLLAGEASRRLVEIAVLHRAIWLVGDILIVVPILLIKTFGRDPAKR
jgi:hypothetical protein